MPRGFSQLLEKPGQPVVLKALHDHMAAQSSKGKEEVTPFEIAEMNRKADHSPITFHPQNLVKKLFIVPTQVRPKIFLVDSWGPKEL